MNQRTLRITALFAMMVLLAAVYWQVLHHDFINYDDPSYVTDNQSVLAGLTTQGIAWAFTTFRASNWHPITWLSHMLDVQLFGIAPAGHHGMNLLLHGINALLLCYLLWSATRRWWPAVFVSALFAFHPLHVESVAWIAERKDLLSTLFMLLCLMSYDRYARSSRTIPYAAALACFALGLMAKPMLVTLPFVLLLWDIWPLGRCALIPLPADNDEAQPPSTAVSVGRLLLEKAPFFLLTIGSCIITFVAQHQGGAVSGLKAIPFSFRLANALTSYFQYLVNTVWPNNLAIIYPLPPTISITSIVVPTLALLLATSAVLWKGRRHPWLLTGWFWYLGTLVPVIGLVQVGQQALADRYTYIPLIGIFIIIAWGGTNLCRQLQLPPQVTAPTAVLVVAIFALLTWQQLSYWKNSITLFSHATAVIPGNHVAYRLLGIALSQNERPAEAIQAFQAAIRIRPDDEDSLTEWGVTLKQAGRPAEAAQLFNRALMIAPSHMYARLQLAQLLKEQGRLPEAIREYELLLQTYPDRYYIQNSLGSAYLEAGNTSKALQHLQLALRLDPVNAEILYNLGLATGMGGNLQESINYLSRAIAIRPDFVEAHFNLGSALAMKGDFEGAEEQFAAALRINPGFAAARTALERARSRARHP